MRILLYKWEAYGERNLLSALRELGHSVIEYDKKIKNHLMDEEFLIHFRGDVEKNKVEAVISFNFFPMLAEGCKDMGIPYLSWIFSRPHYTLYSNTVCYETNYIFCFDREQVEEVRINGGEKVYHLPLAVDVPALSQRIQQAKPEKATDISFVGTLYTDERNYFEEIKGLPSYLLGYIQGICESQLQIFGCDLVSLLLSEEVTEQFRKYVGFEMDASYCLDFKTFFAGIVQKKVTVMERERLLKVLSETFRVALYTGSDTTSLPRVENRGYIHYYHRMPRVFYDSRINLNITLRSITSGIPLRVMDILGCGGFLLSNYQPELAEYFKDGEDMALYGSQGELLEKVDYYLKHGDIRKKIAKAGQERVKELFCYEKQVQEILQKLKEG